MIDYLKVTVKRLSASIYGGSLLFFTSHDEMQSHCFATEPQEIVGV